MKNYDTTKSNLKKPGKFDNITFHDYRKIKYLDVRIPYFLYSSVCCFENATNNTLNLTIKKHSIKGYLEAYFKKHDIKLNEAFKNYFIDNIKLKITFQNLEEFDSKFSGIFYCTDEQLQKYGIDLNKGQRDKLKFKGQTIANELAANLNNTVKKYQDDFQVGLIPDNEVWAKRQKYWEFSGESYQ